MAKLWTVSLASLAAATLACGLFNNVVYSTDLQDDQSAPSRNSGPTIIYQDDFENPESGWDVDRFEHGSVGYAEGEYFVTSTGISHPIYGVAHRSFGDVDIEADAAQVVGPTDDDNDYGLGCAIQDNGDGYYLLISGDGYVSIQIALDSSFSNLVDWEQSSAIHTGDASNHLRAVCQAGALDLYVNDYHVASAQDLTFATGDIALTATSYESDSTEIHFDNLVVRQP
jgi:hypothetical protein